ncbi:MAG: hypothetical protein QGH60_07860 [Phycisphaerae bacterium]|jgi:hypothetical protein|nr:hypothetical protein [Phycisphaerae bacterium]
MNKATGLLNRLIRPAAMCALAGIITALTITAGGQPADRYAQARKVAKGDTPVMQMPGTLASEPQPWPADTVVPNKQNWSLPTARPGHESPSTKAPRLEAIYVRPTILATEYATETYGVQPYPELPPMSPLAWVSFPNSSELSVPATLSGPDGDGAKLSSDPTSRQSRSAVLTGRPLLRDAPAAFRRLTIPEPFALIEAVKFESQAMPPDSDPPTSPKTPPDPTMPITARR